MATYCINKKINNNKMFPIIIICCHCFIKAHTKTTINSYLLTYYGLSFENLQTLLNIVVLRQKHPYQVKFVLLYYKE